MSARTIELETLTLGALLNARALDTTSNVLLGRVSLSTRDFTDQRNAAVFGAIKAIADRGGTADGPTVAALLKHPAVTYEWLINAQNLNELTLEALDAHAEELRRLSRLRSLEAHATSLVQATQQVNANPTELAAMNAAFAAHFTAGAELDETGAADIYEIREDWDAFLAGRRDPFLQTGIEVLDEHFRGFVPNLNLIGGRASVGKTALIATMVWRWLEQGHRIGIFGLEDGTRWIVERHLAQSLQIRLEDVAASHLPAEKEELCQELLGRWAPKLEQQLLVYRKSGISAPDLLDRARRWIHVHKVSALVVDHGGEIRHEKPGAKDRHDLAVKATLEGLRDLAHNTKTPIIVLWHLNREGAKAGQPTMESFKESGYLEAMARTMLGLWERPESPGQLLVTVVKATKGERDLTVAVDRDVTSALVKRGGGHFVDIRAEQRAEEERKTRSPTRNNAKAKDLFGNFA